jgi:hypothetical protein
MHYDAFLDRSCAEMCMFSPIIPGNSNARLISSNDASICGNGRLLKNRTEGLSGGCDASNAALLSPCWRSGLRDSELRQRLGDGQRWRGWQPEHPHEVVGGSG